MVSQIFDLVGRMAFRLLSVQTVYALVIFMLVVAVGMVVRKKSPYLMYCLWSVVMLRFLLPPNYSFPVSLRSLWESMIVTEWPLDRALELHKMAIPALSGPVFPGTPLLSWHVLMVLAWVFCFLLLMYLYRARRRWFRRLTESAEVISDAELTDLVERWRRHFGIRRRVTLLASSANISPFTFGVIAPRICIPECVLEKLPRASLEVIIAHEMAHISRYDDLWLRIQRVIQRIFFFHPVVWICNRQIEEQRELICDRMVLAQGSISASHYGRTLLEVLNITSQTPLAGSAAHYISHNHFYRNRLQALIKNETTSGGQKAVAILITSVMVMFVLPLAPADVYEKRRQSVALDLAVRQSGMNLPVYPYPLKEMKVISRFGARQLVIPAPESNEFHTGIDLAASKGEPVYAVSDAVVEVAHEGSMDATSLVSGGYVLLRHDDGLKTLYAHVSPVRVKPGQRVVKGEVLGFVCLALNLTSGEIDATLHFEVIKQDIRLDPVRFIRLSG